MGVVQWVFVVIITGFRFEIGVNVMGFRIKFGVIVMGLGFEIGVMGGFLEGMEVRKAQA